MSGFFHSTNPDKHETNKAEENRLPAMSGFFHSTLIIAAAIIAVTVIVLSIARYVGLFSFHSTKEDFAALLKNRLPAMSGFFHSTQC